MFFSGILWRSILQDQGGHYLSGIANSKTMDTKIIKDLDVVLYEVIEPELKPSDQMKYLSKTLSSLIDALLPVLAAREILSFLLFKVSMSFNFNSNSIISLSLKGSTEPSTCVILLSS